MTGTIAQIIALVLHINAALRGMPLNFTADHSTSKFCNAIEFKEVAKSGKREQEKMLAGSVAEWLPYLKKEGISQLRLEYASSNNTDLSDRMSAGFVGGGGRWLIIAERTDGKPDVWEPRWEVTREKDPNQRIWTVTYGLIAKQFSVPQSSRHSLDESFSKFQDALNEISSFAHEKKVDNFADLFDKAKDSLHLTSNLPVPYHADLYPDVPLPDRAKRILAAVQFASVFGGMGSWNDLGFDGADQKTYERVSEQLFKSLSLAIVAAVNSWPETARAIAKPWYKLW